MPRTMIGVPEQSTLFDLPVPPTPGIVGRVVIEPITVNEANRVTRRWHPHLTPVTTNPVFAVAAADRVTVRAVAIVTRPPARLDDGRTVELRRLLSDGASEAERVVLSAAQRAARSLGWRTMVAYTAPDDPAGAVLQQAGWVRSSGKATRKVLWTAPPTRTR